MSSHSMPARHLLVPLVIALSILTATGVSMTSCGKDEVVYPSLYLSVTADAAPDGAQYQRLVVILRKAEGNTAVLFPGADYADHRHELPLPGSVDITTAPYVVSVAAGEIFRGQAYAQIWGLTQNQDSPTAVWAGRVNLDEKAQVEVHLSLLADGCDRDHDGVKDCEDAACCSEGDLVFMDCAPDDKLVNPLVGLPECVPCGLTAEDINCDGTPDPCTDADADQAEDCNPAVDCDPGDKTVFAAADELCDGKDNNCNGKTDEGLGGTACEVTNDFGTCKGSEVCEATSGIRCAAETPAEEVCDDVDNDCDGETDEGLPGCKGWDGDWDGDGKLGADDCNPYDARFGVGSTYAGCCDPLMKDDLDAAALLAACDFDCDGTPTLCAAGDSDFDGVPDDVEEAACPAGAASDPTVYPKFGDAPGAPEKCGDGVAQDCAGADIACDTGVDADGDHYFAADDCDDNDPDRFPSNSEVCDGKDNDCNGIVDDGNPVGGEVGEDGAGGCINPGAPTGVCTLPENFGHVVCGHGLSSDAAPDWVKAQVQDGGDVAVLCVDFVPPPAAESYCDDRDEDCDGDTDEDFTYPELYDPSVTLKKGATCGTGACTTLAEAEGALSVVVCAPNAADKGVDQQLTCSSLVFAVPENDPSLAASNYCDNVDNDCDGVTDGHSLALTMTTCKQLGECSLDNSGANIKTTCVAGVWQCDYSGIASYDGDSEVRCDGLDNDCDGQADEDMAWQGNVFGQPCDGIGACAAGTVECSTTPGALVATCSTNVDGSDPQDSAEICDGIDNDCDGDTDDGLTYEGQPVGGVCDGIGECGVGVVECSKLATVTTCSTNPDGSAPELSGEVCDELDNNCDGQTDEGLAWQGISKGAACDGIGACGMGTVVCATNAAVATCSTNPDGPAAADSLEVCDFLDNNCDGQTDEGQAWDSGNGILALGQGCDGIGECGVGVVTCAASGAPVATCSTNPNGPASEMVAEICDALDNDCDGTADDGLTWEGKALGEACDGIGECGAGTVECSVDGAAVATCSTNPDGNAAANVDEICDGKDNDCNGQTDDGTGTQTVGVKCSLIGVCNQANVVAKCLGGNNTWQCDYTNVTSYESIELSCDGLDNNCDGITDESTIQLSPQKPTCDKLVGVCVGMEPSCLGLTGWDCVYSNIDTYSDSEGVAECDGLDNDCDGLTDEAFQTKGNACSKGVGQCQKSGELICNGAHNGVVCSVSGAFAGTTCDDGNACSHSDQCSGGDSSACGGTAYVCPDDGLSCTTDTCNGDNTCAHDLIAGSCLIGGVCYTTGTLNPLNPCQVCQAQQSTSAWSLVANGVACSDQNECTTQDACDGAGTCVGQGDNPCDDNLACTVNGCTPKPGGKFDCSYDILVPGTCKVGGVCFSTGQENPTNPCGQCDPQQNALGWTNKPSGTACDDGLTCSLADTCQSGQCLGIQNDCDDGNECTTDSCDNGGAGDGCVNAPLNAIPCTADQYSCTNDVCSAGICKHLVKGGTCFVSGTCYANGDLDPNNDCLGCQTNITQLGFSPKPSQTACSDNDACTDPDTCDGFGVCDSGAAVDCDDKNPCTVDLCLKDQGCVHQVLADGIGCPDDGLTCTIDKCIGGVCAHGQIAADSCLIGGVCVKEQATPTNPAEPCMACRPLVTQSAYSPKDAGVSCDKDSTGCTVDDACDGKGACLAGSPPDCSSADDACNVGVCFSSGTNTYQCNKQPRANGTSCTADALTCTTDACSAGQCKATLATGCLINGACVADGTLKADNDCMACQPQVSDSDYSPLGNGVSCASDGVACTTDSCDGAGLCTHIQAASTCVIGGTCYSAGDLNPANSCQSCQPLTSAGGWSSLAASTACQSDGLSCTSDLCDGSGTCLHTTTTGNCLISVSGTPTCFAGGDSDPSNPCKKCDPTTPSFFLNRGIVDSCPDDGNACTLDHCDGGGACIHDNKSDGTACDVDALTCTSETCQTGTCTLAINDATCLVAGTCYAEGDANPANECTSCQAATSKTAFSDVSDGTHCGTVCAVCTAGTCTADLTQDALCGDCGQCAAKDQCDPSAQGTDVVACGTYVCDGTTMTCPGTCLADSDCKAGNYCDAQNICTAKLAQGTACSASNACLSGFCADGFCCNAICGGPCDSCGETGQEGTCKVLASGVTPQSSCGTYLCDGTGPGCPTTCAADGDCVTGNYCDATSHCVPKLLPGAACGAGTECASGFCVDGVCCDTACGDACDACDVSGAVGTCTVLTAGTTPQSTCGDYLCGGAASTCPNSCTGDGDCVASAYCNGAGQCVPKMASGSDCSAVGDGAHACADGFCADGVCCSTACDGACDACDTGTVGTCALLADGVTPQTSCSGFLCDGAAAGCPVTCAGDADCIAADFCDAANVCVVKQSLGAACTATTQCASGNCVDGVCCDTVCDGACDACDTGTVGICELLASGATPQTSCDPYLCDGASTACPTVCANDSQCASGNYCDATLHCVPKLAPGAVCGAANACQSGFCVDGVCCNTACDGACDACNLLASKGTCTVLPDGSVPQADCSGYLCDGTLTGCASTCASHLDCDSPHYCDSGTSHCAADKGTGAICTDNEECLSDLCSLANLCTAP